MKLLVDGRCLGAQLGSGRGVIVCDDGRELRRADAGVVDGKVRLLEASAEEWEQLRTRGFPAAMWARRSPETT